MPRLAVGRRLINYSSMRPGRPGEFANNALCNMIWRWVQMCLGADDRMDGFSSWSTAVIEDRDLRGLSGGVLRHNAARAGVANGQTLTERIDRVPPVPHSGGGLFCR